MNGALLLLALLNTLASPAKPPSPEEQRLFADGLKAFEAGNPREAERLWKEGYAVGRDPAFLIRIGEAQEKAGAPTEAVESYRRYLREVPDAADRADIEKRLERLAPAGVTTTPAAPSTASPPGAPREEVKAFGSAPAAAPVPPAPAPGPQGMDNELAPRAFDDESGWTPYNITAWVSLAATATLLGVAGFFGASAASKSDDVNVLTNYRDEQSGRPLEYADVRGQYEDAMDDGKRYERFATYALIGAGVTTLVATTFFILDARTPRQPAVGLLRSPNGRALAPALTWSF